MSQRPTSVPSVPRKKPAAKPLAAPKSPALRNTRYREYEPEDDLDGFDMIAFGMEWLTVMAVMFIAVTSCAVFVIAPIVKFFAEH